MQQLSKLQLFVAKSWAEDGGEAGYTDAMELLDLGLHLIGDESEEVSLSIGVCCG